MIELVEQGRVPMKLWTDGVEVEHEAMAQIRNVASLPVVGPHVAIMPDVHWGVGATVGSVIPTRAAIIPAAVGVDLGCGMMAVRTDLTVNELAGNLAVIRDAIERAIPVGGPGIKGSWDQRGPTPARVLTVWEQEFKDAFARIQARHPKIRQQPTVTQLGTLGTGNHFIEVCQDLEDGGVWFMLHSGSRGVGNRIGTYFIEQAKEQALRLDRTVKTDVNLAWLDEGTALFDDYVEAVGWAQRYARRNRDLMMERVVAAVRGVLAIPFRADLVTVSCHHNYVEERGGLYLTRKGAVSAKLGELGIIPGSMGAKSFVVRGLGHPESFESCSHGAGRRMSRGAAKRAFTVGDVRAQTAGVECRKDAGIIDELPGAYKNIDAVMVDLVEVVATLKALVSVKG
jgi:tRNA-splicing ligase RtcB (3'-phosphate/5'-hydroxy nucleic acid ligase)